MPVGQEILQNNENVSSDSTLAQSSVLNRTKSYSASRLDEANVDCESNLVQYSSCVKSSLVRPSSSNDKSNLSTATKSTDTNFSSFSAHCQINAISQSTTSTCCLDDSYCLRESSQMAFNKPNVYPSSPLSDHSRRRHSHVEVLEKYPCQSRSPPPPLDIIAAAVDDNALVNTFSRISQPGCNLPNDNVDLQTPPLAQAIVAALRQQTLLRSATNTSTASSSRFSPNYLTAEDDDDDDDDDGKRYHSDEYGYDEWNSPDQTEASCATPHMDLDRESGYGGASCSSSSIRLNYSKNLKQRDKRKSRRKNQRSISLNMDQPANHGYLHHHHHHHHHRDYLFDMRDSFHHTDTAASRDCDLAVPVDDKRASMIKRHKRHRVRIVDDSSINSPVHPTSFGQSIPCLVPLLMNFFDSSQSPADRNVLTYSMNSAVYDASRTVPNDVLLATTTTTNASDAFGPCHIINNNNTERLEVCRTYVDSNEASPDLSPLAMELAPGSAFPPPPDAVPTQSILVINNDSLSVSASNGGPSCISSTPSRSSITLASCATTTGANSTTSHDCQPTRPSLWKHHSSCDFPFSQSNCCQLPPNIYHHPHDRTIKRCPPCAMTATKCACAYPNSTFQPPYDHDHHWCACSNSYMVHSCTCHFYHHHHHHQSHTHPYRSYPNDVYDSATSPATLPYDHDASRSQTCKTNNNDVCDDEVVNLPHHYKFCQPSVRHDTTETDRIDNKDQRRSYSLSALPLYEVNLTCPNSSSTNQRVNLIVDNVRFIIDVALLQAHPNTMLGCMFSSGFVESRRLQDVCSKTTLSSASSTASSSTSSSNSMYRKFSSDSAKTHLTSRDVLIAQDSNITAQVFRAILDYYLSGCMSCPPGVSVQELKEASDYFLIPFNHQTVKCGNLRAFLHELSNDGAHTIFERFLEAHILSLLVKCTQFGERECHVVIVTNDEIIDWDPDYPPQMPENELNSHIVHSTQMFRFLKYIENREVAKQVLVERGLKKIRIGIEGYPTSKDRIKFRPRWRLEAIYNYVQCPFLHMSWEEEENKSRHVDFQCVKSKSVSDLTTGLEQAVIDPLPPHLAVLGHTSQHPESSTLETEFHVTADSGEPNVGDDPLVVTTLDEPDLVVTVASETSDSPSITHGDDNTLFVRSTNNGTSLR